MMYNLKKILKISYSSCYRDESDGNESEEDEECEEMALVVKHMQFL